MSVTVMGRKLAMPIFCSPTALQRLFHHDGERAVARAAEKFGTMFGVSSLGTVSVEEIGAMTKTPKMFQLYFHKDRGLTNAMIERVKEAKFDAIALTVDTITGGNRERDLRTGFTSPPRLTPSSLVSFALHPRWAFNYFTHEKFELPELKDHVKEGSKCRNFRWRLFLHHARSVDELGRCGGGSEKLGRRVLSERRDERGRCPARG